MIDKVFATGNNLVKAKHFATPAINARIDELNDNWGELLKQSDNRKKNLDLSLRRQKVFNISFVKLLSLSWLYK